MTGRSLLGGFGYYDYPFINFFKGAGTFQGGTGFPGILDANGYPTGTLASSYYTNNMYIPPSYTGHWFIDWQGAGALQINPNVAGTITVHSGGGFVSGNTVSGTNPAVEFSFPAGTASLNLVFPAGTTFASMSNARLYQAGQDATDVTAGEIFRKDFLDVMRYLSPRIIRPLGWDLVNDLNCVSKYNNNPARFHWFGSDWIPTQWAGTVSGTNTYTCSRPTDSTTSWVDRETISGTVTNANTSTTVTLQPSGKTAKTVARIHGGVLSVGTIAVGLATFVYDAGFDKLLYVHEGPQLSVPLSAMVALANKLPCDLWTNIPHLYEDAAVDAYAQYVRDNLSSGLKWFAEYSNELWNFAFEQYAWMNNHGTVAGYAQAPFSYSGLRIRQVQGRITSAWSPRTSAELRRVMGTQTEISSTATETAYRFNGAELSAFGYNTAPNRPIDYCDLIAVANYYDGGKLLALETFYDIPSSPSTFFAGLLAAADDYASGTPSRMTAALTWCDSDLTSGIDWDGNRAYGTQDHFNIQIWPMWKTTADSYGKPLYCYEGGLETVPPPPTGIFGATYGGASGRVAVLIDAYKSSANFYTLMLAGYNAFVNVADGIAPAALNLAGSGQWNIIDPDLYGGRWKSYDAIAAFNGLGSVIRLKWA